MEELHKTISELTFASFCSDISLHDDSSIEFKLKYRFHGNRKEDVFCIQKTGEGMLLSDKGSTLANLDNIFELSEPDVIRNIGTVLEELNMRSEDDAFVCNIDPSRDMFPQILRFLQGIHFLYTMILFYA